MPKINFNVRTVAAIEPPTKGQVDYWDKGLTGFVLRVSAGGKMAWGVIYRNSVGKKKRLSVGAYPSMGVADAREKVYEELGRIGKAVDPSAEKKVERRAGTFSELADLYLNKYAKGEAFTKWKQGVAVGISPEPNKRSWKSDKLVIDRDLAPWG